MTSTLELGGTLCGGKESLFGTALVTNDNGRLLHVLGGTLCGGKESLFGTALVTNDNGRLLHVLGGTLCGGKESLFGTALITNDNGRLLHVLGGTLCGGKESLFGTALITNDNGRLLHVFCAEYLLAITNTILQTERSPENILDSSSGQQLASSSLCCAPTGPEGRSSHESDAKCGVLPETLQC